MSNKSLFGSASHFANVGSWKAGRRISNPLTWADDLALIGTSPRPIDLIPQVQVIAETLFSELFAMGLQPNFQKGKTEAVISLRGPKKVAVQQLLHGPQQSSISLPALPPGADQLRVVPHYTHLGGLISHGGRLKGEIRRRIGIARQSFQDLSPKVFSNAKVALPTRVAIFKATVWLSLTYNIGTWSRLTDSELHIWHCGVLRLYRLLLRRLFPAQVVRHFSEDEVVSLVGLPLPLVALRVCRLRHFAQVLSRGTPFFWALVAEEDNWLQAVRGDFEWLYSQISGLTFLPPPSEDPLAWHQFILNSLPKWKGLLKRVSSHCILVDSIYADVRTFHRKLLDILFQGGLRHLSTDIPPELPGSLDEDRHVCWICSKSFASFKAWGSHSFKVHGRTNACRHLQEGSICEACGKQYPSHERLIRHLRTHAPCRQTLATLRRFVDAQPYYGSNTVRERLPADSMKTWLPTDLPTAPPGVGWPMTSSMRTCLQLISTPSWGNVPDEQVAQLHGTLRLHPVHHSEMSHLMDALDLFYANSPVALSNLATLRDLIDTSFQPSGPSQPPAPPRPPTTWLDEISELYFANVPGVPRMRTKLLYIVHLFSGTKREGDLHSFVAQLPAPDCGIFCPISVDVVLDEAKCNLLSPKQQKIWLSFALQGALYMVVAGPPCETWSVSRMRFLETATGPRPLRSSAKSSISTISCSLVSSSHMEQPRAQSLYCNWVTHLGDHNSVAKPFASLRDTSLFLQLQRRAGHDPAITQSWWHVLLLSRTSNFW